MDVEQILQTHVSQDARVGLAANVARQLLAAYAEIDQQEFVSTKSASLKAEKKVAAEQALVVELKRLEAVVDDEVEVAIARAREAERRRLHEGNGSSPHVEVARVDRATSPAELALLLQEAESIGPHEVRRVFGFAKPLLEQMARQDVRSNRIPSRAGALSVLTRWQMRVRDLGVRAPDEASVRERGRHEKASVRARLANIAAVASIDLPRVVRVAAATPSGVRPNITFGRFWETQGSK
jgi:hypothetical protein